MDTGKIMLWLKTKELHLFRHEGNTENSREC